MEYFYTHAVHTDSACDEPKTKYEIWDKYKYIENGEKNANLSLVQRNRDKQIIQLVVDLVKMETKNIIHRKFEGRKTF